MTICTATRGSGFTLLEMMVAVAVFAILMSMALPTYLSYTVRKQVTEALSIPLELRGKVYSFYKVNGTFPKDNEEAGIPVANKLIGNYVTRTDLIDGAFHVTLGNRANKKLVGKTISYRPAVVKDSPASPISWLCGQAEAVEGMVAVGTNETTIKPPLLPYGCF
ncbi:pilin [Oleiphilus messinensis]|nr:pilin [Oleiphilus messinensis]